MMVIFFLDLNVLNNIMKNTLSILLGMLLIYSCSTTNDIQLPASPENLMVEATSNTTIQLMWTDRSTNETGFKIERKLVGGKFAVVGTTSTDVTIFSDTNLTPSTTYIYRVYSYNTGGNSTVYSNELMPTTNSSIPPNTNPYLPNYTFTVDININLPSYSNLKFPSNGIYYSAVGARGIIIFNTGSGYNAFDAACPNQSLGSCSTMTINGINAICSCDNAEYSLFTGQSPGKQYPLKQYRVEVNGSLLRVYN